MKKNNKKSLRHVFTSFFKVGLIGFGGGSALIPIIEKEVVLQKKYITEDVYREHTIISNVTPGALPVKLGAASGSEMAGHRGMFLGAYSVAIPGTFLTIVLLSLLSLMDSGFLRYVEYASIGVTAFIVVLLLEYISKVLANSRDVSFGKQAVAIMLGTAFLTFGREIRMFFGHFISTMPESWLRPILDVSTIDLLLLAFFMIGGTEESIKKPRSIIVLALGLLFLFMVGDFTETEGFFLAIARSLLILLVVLFVLYDARKEEPAGRALDMRKPLRQSILFLVVIVALTTASLIALGGIQGYVANGFISTVTSFGGGEAYLTVADGIFVGSGYVSSGDFYGQVLPIANALPGPILVKMLAGVGYLKGFELAGIGGGYLLSALGASIGIGASVIVFAFVQEIYSSFSDLKVFRLLNILILPVVCGLLISTIIAMLNESLRILDEASLGRGVSVALILMSFAIIYLLQKKFGLHDVIVLILLALITFGSVVFLV